jgi:hypothetical protein
LSGLGQGETTANYNYLEIFYTKAGSGAGYAYAKIFDPNGKKVNLNLIKGNTNNVITIYNSTFTINDTSISLDAGKSIALSNTGSVGGFSNTGELSIYKVVGY